MPHLIFDQMKRLVDSNISRHDPHSTLEVSLPYKSGPHL